MEPDSLQERLAAIASLKEQLDFNKIAKEDPKPPKKTFRKPDPVPEPAPEPPKPTLEDLPQSEDPNLLTKAEAIEKILKLQELTGLPVGQKKKWTKTPLDNMRKEKVIEVLAGLMNMGAAKLNLPPEAPTHQVINDETGKPTGLVPISKSKAKWSRDFGGAALYNMQYSFIKFMEFVSVNPRLGVKDAFGTNLEGLGASVDSDRELLLELMKEIWDEHGEEIQKYLSAIERYAMIMSMHVGGTLAQNGLSKKLGTDSFTSGFVPMSPLKVVPPPSTPSIIIPPTSATDSGSTSVSSTTV